MGDLIRSLRSLWRQPLLCAASVGALAAGVAVCAVGVSLLESILLDPLPYADADRLAMVWRVRPDQPDRRLPVSRRTFDESRRTTRAFSQLAATRDWPFVVAGREGAEQRWGGLASEDFLAALRAPLAAGRHFTPDDFASGGRAVILSHRFWLERYGGDPDAVGSAISLNDGSFTIVGVLAESFAFLPRPNTDIWAPLALDPDQQAYPDRGALWVIGRLDGAATLAAAQGEMDSIAARLEGTMPAERKGLGFRLISLQEQIVGEAHASLLGVWGATTLVFLIACCNVVGLLAARWLAQRREFAIRAAVGAAPTQLARLIACDIFWIALLGTAAGLLLSVALIDLIVSLNPTVFPRMQEVAVNWSGAAFTAVLGVLGIVGIGLPNLIRATRARIAADLKLDRSAGGGRFRRWSAQDGLIALETALAFAMVTAAALMLQTVVRMEKFDLGFDSGGLLTARLPISLSTYPTEESVRSHYRTVLASLEGQPGVTEVGASTSLPLSGIRETVPLAVGDGAPAATLFAEVSPGYFGTMRIPLLRGRTFTDYDDARSSLVAIIDASFARSRFDGRDPIGHAIALGEPPGMRATVVGVVGDVRQAGPRAAQEPMVYLPLLQSPRWNTFVALRTDSSAPADLAGGLRSTVAAVDRNQLVTGIRTMQQRLDGRVRRPRFSLFVFSAFGLIALVLALVGVYSVSSYVTRRRTKEFGIQLALGASTAQIARSVVARGVRPVLAGSLAGLFIAFAFAHLLESQLFGVQPLDPVSLLAGFLLLIAAGVLGSYVPARRAARVDPLTAIRLA